MSDVAGRLRELADAALGDDPWYPVQDEIRTKNPDEIRLIALAPALARGYADALDALEDLCIGRGPNPVAKARAVLAEADRLLGLLP